LRLSCITTARSCWISTKRRIYAIRRNPAAHVGADRQRTRQRAAIGAFARSAGYEFVGEY
jgi:hypothetical protein